MIKKNPRTIYAEVKTASAKPRTLNLEVNSFEIEPELVDCKIEPELVDCKIERIKIGKVEPIRVNFKKVVQSRQRRLR